MARKSKRPGTHPLREELKATLKAADYPMSATELAGIYRQPVSRIAYHLHVLYKAKEIAIASDRPTDGYVLYRYEPVA